MDECVSVFRQLENVFPPYRAMLKEMKGSTSHHSVSANKKTLKILYIVWNGAFKYSRIFAFPRKTRDEREWFRIMSDGKLW